MDIEVKIDNLIDKAIIKSFEKAERGILQRKAIIKLVKEQINEKDLIIAKRIEKMTKSEYLIRVKRGLYKLKPGCKFIFEGESLPSEEGPEEIPAEIRRSILLI